MSEHQKPANPIDTPKNRIHHARLLSGMSISKISLLTEIHPDYYRHFENNFLRCRPKTIRAFSTVTGCDLGWIIYGEEQPPMVSLSGDTIGQRLLAFRELNNISRKQLAQEAFGVSKKASIASWEREEYAPELLSLMRIADAYGVNVVSFIP